MKRGVTVGIAVGLGQQGSGTFRLMWYCVDEHTESILMYTLSALQLPDRHVLPVL